MTEKRVWLFEEGDASMRNLLGGKGANLAEMTNLGLPVPPGLTITTETCMDYINHGNKMPLGVMDEVKEALKKIEEKTGKKFGDPENPLLVSVRSGARLSMPGMMETILNLGMNDQTVEGMIKLTNNPRFCYDSYRRFLTMFGSVAWDIERMKFEEYIDKIKAEKGYKQDVDLTAEDWKSLIEPYKALIKAETGKEFPQDPYVQLEEAIETYKKLGAIVEEFSLDIADYALATYYIIACAEASSNLGRFDGIRYGYRTTNYTNLKDIYRNSRSEGFGPEVKRRIILGTYVLSSGYYDAYYKKAQQVRTLVKKEFDEAFKKYDVLLTPTSPTVAFEIGTKSSNPLEMYLADICTVPVNIAGLPGISVPCGVDSKGMPIGMQLIGNRFEEEKILNAAYTFEQEIKFRENYKPEFRK